jgi:hypothetical protein
VTPQLVVREIFATPERYEELRRNLMAEWQAGPEHRSPLAQAIFAELGLDGGADGWRPLVESPTFLAALADEPMAAAA